MIFFQQNWMDFTEIQLVVLTITVMYGTLTLMHVIPLRMTFTSLKQSVTSSIC